MKKNFLKILLIFIIFVISIACGKKEDTIKVVFLPNESNESLKNSRDELAKIIEGATNKKVEIITTTDYNIAIENIISGKAQIAYIGAEAVLSASERNANVQAVLTNAGESGTREDALYYSFLAVRSEDAEQYKTNGEFDLKKIKGKSIAFVTNTSTSGFIIPARSIVKEFGLKDTDEVLEEGKLFSKIIFGNSHPGTQVNLFRKDAEVATFAIPKSFSIYELVSGEENKAGSTYKVKVEAVAPFSDHVGKSFTVIKSIPVLNGAITFNIKTLSKKDQDKIKEKLLSKETTDNPLIFGEKESKIRGLFAKQNKEVGFVEVDNKWYEQIKDAK
ncbi:MAG: phosphate/phosphite/phosphonate ABC transporter substrate-binding protein [Leptotrichiaceae bacterium]|jgi:phosphonate transport system substrate-binding protein|nr:phosphate/phosphite/phosphonate ABC transporter substrate-binding protein [Leptotrichiaceae bacterium]MBP6280807.1 phosphate/phosphite/phosphonate ABC transporter substrate-binding protein [Leptotrichiaceae bacterium]MBP9629758.1 phosphate/phosphite/phosphonate ABC transporter substrate-binding protein [Leptotrichiaceae bacterium]